MGIRQGWMVFVALLALGASGCMFAVETGFGGTRAVGDGRGGGSQFQFTGQLPVYGSEKSFVTLGGGIRSSNSANGGVLVASYTRMMQGPVPKDKNDSDIPRGRVLFLNALVSVAEVGNADVVELFPNGQACYSIRLFMPCVTAGPTIGAFDGDLVIGVQLGFKLWWILVA